MELVRMENRFNDRKCFKGGVSSPLRPQVVMLGGGGGGGGGPVAFFYPPYFWNGTVGNISPGWSQFGWKS